ncbi:MAG TPA: TMEM43 family protein [Xanthomonadales bacterium]|nr:TMEM43 family protein [Xanthomonadales bacterium]
MVDVFRDTTQESLGARLKGAFGGILVGLAMFVAAFPLQWWNEGRAVHRRDSLNEGAAAVVYATPDRVDPALEGRLVHLTGKVSAPAPLVDDAFGISADALALERDVEMYQWREKRETKETRKLGGGTERTTEYSYSLAWNSDPVDSSDFRHREGHENPGALPLASRKVSVDHAQLGAYTLDSGIAKRFDEWRAFDVPETAASTDADFRRVESGFYRGADPGAPKLGDVRVKFRHVPEGDYSFVAKQSGRGLAEYATKAGDGILLVEHGTHDAKEMFANAHSANEMLAWLLRGIGFALMWIGLSLVLRPIAVVADVVPLLGTLLSKGLGFVAFVFAACFSLLTIAAAWLRYRPGLGIALVVAVVLLVGWLRKRAPRVQPGVAMPPPPPATPPLGAIPPPPPAS